MSTGWVYHPFFLRHDTGMMHPERADRLNAILQMLEDRELLASLVEIAFDPLPREALELVHHPAYVDLIEMACKEELPFIGSRETRICRESFDVALLAVSGILKACDVLIAGSIRNAFCAIRPPGHHAGESQAEGFCLFNNVALAAEHLIRKHKLSRIAIVDWDVHHGNGTQSIFYDRADVLYISLHEDPAHLYPHTGTPAERGHGDGEGYTLNLPMRPGSKDAHYHEAFTEQVVPALQTYQPQALLISAGLDAAAADPTADIQLSPESFGWMTDRLCELCENHPIKGPISILEGGYDLHTLAECAYHHIHALMR